jgi:pimeloyl-ACP methyl ester carboxylesterase
MGERLREVTTRTGRRLAVAQWGDLSGVPVFSLHGTPGSRLGRHPDEDALRAIGARVITYDRPGYGFSTRNPGRRVVDCLVDVDTLVAHLRLASFSVTGSSGGGPHVLAVAARRPDRVLRARCNAGLAPYDADGLDFYAGMDPHNASEFRWAVEGEERLFRGITEQLDELQRRMRADPSLFLGEEWALDDSDRRVLSEPALADQNLAVVEEVARGKGWGWVDDSMAFVREWGFDVEEVQVPIRVTYGGKDVVVPPGHGAWLGSRIPGAEVLVAGAGGHLLPSSSVEGSLRWLVTGR